MLSSNDMKKLLDIQDKNIIIEKNAIEVKQFKGKTAKFITAKLTYTPTHCECSGVVNKDYVIYKNGTKESRITLPISGVHLKKSIRGDFTQNFLRWASFFKRL